MAWRCVAVWMVRIIGPVGVEGVAAVWPGTGLFISTGPAAQLQLPLAIMHYLSLARLKLPLAAAAVAGTDSISEGYHTTQPHHTPNHPGTDGPPPDDLGVR